MKRIFKYIFHYHHWGVCITTFILLWLLKTITFNLDILNPVADALENFSASDIFFDIEHSGSEPEVSDLITIVDMTELHDRGDIGIMLEEINLNDPLLVGIDLIFEGVKDDEIGNEILENSVEGLSDIAVFSQKLVDYDSKQEEFTGSVRSYFANDFEINEAYTNLKNNMSGACVREMSIKQTCNGQEELSFPARLAAVFDESLYSRGNEDLMINYRNVKFPVIKWNEIAENCDLIEGHIVLVGTMTEEQDMHMTPLGKMPGLELQAYSLLTLLEHNDIDKLPLWATLLIAFFICYLLELCIDSTHRLIDKYPDSAILTFIKESELTILILMFIFIVASCWISFVLFVDHSILIDSDIIFALLVLLFEGQKIYTALIMSIKKLYTKQGSNRR